MSEFYRFNNMKFDSINECIRFIREDYKGDISETKFVVERVIVSNSDQWGTYSETVQDIHLELWRMKE